MPLIAVPSSTEIDALRRITTNQWVSPCKSRALPFDIQGWIASLSRHAEEVMEGLIGGWAGAAGPRGLKERTSWVTRKERSWVWLSAARYSIELWKKEQSPSKATKSKTQNCDYQLGEWRMRPSQRTFLPTKYNQHFNWVIHVAKYFASV